MSTELTMQRKTAIDLHYQDRRTLSITVTEICIAIMSDCDITRWLELRRGCKPPPPDARFSIRIWAPSIVHIELIRLSVFSKAAFRYRKKVRLGVVKWFDGDSLDQFLYLNPWVVQESMNLVRKYIIPQPSYMQIYFKKAHFIKGVEK